MLLKNESEIEPMSRVLHSKSDFYSSQGNFLLKNRTENMGPGPGKYRLPSEFGDHLPYKT